MPTKVQKMARGLPKKFSSKAMARLGSNGERIATRLVQIALNDEHDGQLSAIKICMDRLVPIQKAVDAGALEGRQINIQVNVEKANPKAVNE